MNKSDLLSNPLLDEPTKTKQPESSDQFLNTMFKEMFKGAVTKVSARVDEVAGKAIDGVIKNTQGQTILGSTRSTFQHPDMLEAFRDHWIEKYIEPWKKTTLRNYCSQQRDDMTLYGSMEERMLGWRFNGNVLNKLLHSDFVNVNPLPYANGTVMEIVNGQIQQQVVQVRHNRLSQMTHELMEDLQGSMFELDAVDDFAAIMAEELHAQLVTNISDLSQSAGFMNDPYTVFDQLFVQCSKLSQRSYARGKAEVWIITDINGIDLLKASSDLEAMTKGSKLRFTMDEEELPKSALVYVGSLWKNVKVYCSTRVRPGGIIVGSKSNTIDEGAISYCPHTPITIGGTVVDPMDYRPIIPLGTRAGWNIPKQSELYQLFQYNKELATFIRGEVQAINRNNTSSASDISAP